MAEKLLIIFNICGKWASIILQKSFKSIIRFKLTNREFNNWFKARFKNQKRFYTIPIVFKVIQNPLNFFFQNSKKTIWDDSLG